MRHKTCIAVISVLLILSSILVLSGCEELVQEIVASAKVKSEAQTMGTLTFCPDERPYRVGGIKGICVDEDGLSEYTGLKLHGTEEEQNVFVKTTKALQKGADKECPKETPYYVSGFLFFGGKCVSKADFNQYLADGILDKEDEKDKEEPEAEAKDCHYDSDCDPVCEGKVAWKQGCNPRTNKCENTFETDCSEDKETFGDFTFAKTCVNGRCVRDTDAIQDQRQELVNLRTEKSNKFKELTGQKQTAQQIMMDANKNCINGLADVTNKFIVESALSLASPAKKVADVATDVTSAIMDEMISKRNKMSPEEFIKQNCDLYEALKKDLASTEIKLAKLKQESEEITEQIKSLPE